MSTKIAIPQSRAARETLCKGLMMGSVGHFRSHGHFSRKRQKSERPEADRRNYSRSRSHLRAAAAMIGIKSPGLDGGCTGVRAKTGTCSWGRAVPPYYLGGARCLTRLSSIGAARLAATFLDLGIRRRSVFTAAVEGGCFLCLNAKDTISYRYLAPALFPREFLGRWTSR
jgi:hypothetical protein